jgi:hypothetical protein
VVTRAVVLLASLALIAGCGSEEGDGSLAALDQAARKAESTESYRYVARMSSNLPDQDLRFDGTGTSSADSKQGTMEGTLDVGQGPLAFQGIVHDGLMYMRGEDLGLPKGKWVKMQDPPTSTLSPSEFVGFLRDSDGVERVGAATIRGEETTHYRGSLDIEELAEESGSEIVERLRNTPNVDDLDITVDVWVGDDRLPARLALELSARDQVSGSMKITSDVLEYDVPVEADPPPAESVVEAQGLGGPS